MLFSSVELVRVNDGPWLHFPSKRRQALCQYLFDSIFRFVFLIFEAA